MDRAVTSMMELLESTVVAYKDDGVILDYPTGFNANNFVEEMDVAEIRLTSNYDSKFNFYGWCVNFKNRRRIHL